MILDELRSAYASGDTAKVISLMPQLCDAKGKTVFEMPCNIGDTVYLLGGKGYSQFHVCCVDWKCGIERGKEHYQLYMEDDFCDKAYRNFSDIGKTVFLTEAEAEKALEVQNV